MKSSKSEKCINCDALFSIDYSKNLIGQHHCPKCASNAWVNFLAIINPKVGA